MLAAHIRGPRTLSGRTALVALAIAASSPACGPADGSDAADEAPPAADVRPGSGELSPPPAGPQEPASGSGSPDLDTPRPASPEPPAALVGGRDLFDLHCVQCHGVGGFGTRQGPPLAHEIYRPGHHADISFHLAVQRGVRSHHWNFGDMPPLPDVPVDRIQEIVDYVRWVQREAGIR